MLALSCQEQLQLWHVLVWGFQGLEGHLARQCIPHHLQPDDIVNPCLFLASDAAAMMTAQCMVVDGGVVYTG